MPQFLVQIPDKPGFYEQRMKRRAQHLENFKTNLLGKISIAGGGCFSSDPAEAMAEGKPLPFIGSALILDVESIDEAKKIIESDIYAEPDGPWDTKNATGRLLHSKRNARPFIRLHGTEPSWNLSVKRSVQVFGAVALTATGLVYYDDVKYHATALLRVGRVIPVVSLCFADYGWTLRKDDAEALKACHLRCANRALKLIETNAGIFIKLGQHVSAMTYVLPPEWTTTFIPLQDQCPVSSIDDIAEMIKEDTGHAIDDLFSEFSSEPLGTASLAQVHKAVTKSTGESVAVKLQHPSLKRFIPIDVTTTRAIFTAMNYFFPQYPMIWLADELESSIFVELDFTAEADNAIRTSEHFATRNYQKLTAIRIPKIHWCVPRILVMEYVEGARLDDAEYLYKHAISRRQVAECLANIFNDMIFTPGVNLHCDPHGGNLAIRALEKPKNGHNFEIILYDHGLYRQVSLGTRYNYAGLWLSLISGDLEGMKDYAKEFAHIKDSDLALFVSVITGRTSKSVESKEFLMSFRTKEEREKMVSSIAGGSIFGKIIRLLSHVPPIVLLIFKTNDLVRNLDESLLFADYDGPKDDMSLIQRAKCDLVAKDKPRSYKQFLIMAKYAAWTRLAFDRARFRKSWFSIFLVPYSYLKFFATVAVIDFYDCIFWLRS
ncbi:hypothetical protein CANCADRAFT_44745 [Tortispora caseinolytica NRRL Y-17796]|uniref:ABC1 atypical kinase-like domain-containing protein n=1 Tax=Tortispora caseinolytica NRRL Y-17796 TaxID=767744 RepID=A0A1E4TH97_9ASCO|nr:hypothetical protein CANCADRAFT_44745 [Tortispora caseinolytica NRRL Y-17796]